MLAPGHVDHHRRQVDAEGIQAQVPQVGRDVSRAAAHIRLRPRLPVTRATLNPAFSSARTTCVRRELGASGNVHHEREFVRHAELCDKPCQGFPQVCDSGRWAIALAVGSHTGAQLSVSAPYAVFVLLDGV
jgi:hypothetical protein